MVVDKVRSKKIIVPIAMRPKKRKLSIIEKLQKATKYYKTNFGQNIHPQYNYRYPVQPQQVHYHNSMHEEMQIHLDNQQNYIIQLENYIQQCHFAYATDRGRSPREEANKSLRSNGYEQCNTGIPVKAGINIVFGNRRNPKVHGLATNTHERSAFKALPTIRRRAQFAESSKHSTVRQNEFKYKIHKKQICYYCTECDTKFDSKHALAQHIIIHNNKNPFECEVCSRKFAQKRSLTRHKNKIHNMLTSRQLTYRLQNINNVYAKQRKLNIKKK